MTAMDTTTTTHDWVKHVICPVETLADDDGEPYIFVDPDKVEQAEMEAAYGCRKCNVPLVVGFHTECPGHDDGED